MSIRRLYSLPNCTLIIDGWNDATSAGSSAVRPLLSMLVNAECHLVGLEKPLTGGREFLEGLVTGVSSYAQEFLSGVRLPEKKKSHASVHLEKIGENKHRLIVQSSVVDNSSAGSGVPAIAIDLATVQLFDLVEAVDQFFADTQTLPELSLALRPVSKRYIHSTEPIIQRATPALLGVSGLALAAIALFFVPIPDIERPTEPARESNSSESTSDPLDSPNPNPTPGTAPNPETSLPEESVIETTPSPVSLETLEEIINAAPDITDPTQLSRLNRVLYEQINQAWENRETVEDELAYRVSVGIDGAILGYKPANDAAGDRPNEDIPLSELLYLPANAEQISSESIAQFKVVFKSLGVLEVSPWWGYEGEPGLGPEITDPQLLEDLSQTLNEKLVSNWTVEPNFDRELIYRVGVREDGAIAEYVPVNTAAVNYLNDIPLPSLIQLPVLRANTQPTTTPIIDRPLAQFRVVFMPDKQLQISPWRE